MKCVVTDEDVAIESETEFRYPAQNKFELMRYNHFVLCESNARDTKLIFLEG
jgi:hypothetical protein